jgi:FRG domain
MYRGQSRAEYQLSSSLERLLGSAWTPQAAITYEDRSLSLFKSKYNMYDHSRHEPDSKLSWLSAMQHYGVPTRLIDFTTTDTQVSKAMGVKPTQKRRNVLYGLQPSIVRRFGVWPTGQPIWLYLPANQ